MARVGGGGGKRHPPVLADRHASSLITQEGNGQKDYTMLDSPDLWEKTERDILNRRYNLRLD